MNKLVKMFSGILLILGIAFFIGSFLAYVQNIVIQISILALVGCVCIICSVIGFVIERYMRKS